MQVHGITVQDKDQGVAISSDENLVTAKRPRRHATTGAVLALLPGFGQFYHRQWAKGLCFLILLSSFTGVFHDFLREGFWGLYTLGESVPRDNSIFLLAEGIISVLIAAFGVAVWGVSMRDAWRAGNAGSVGASQCCPGAERIRQAGAKSGTG